MSEITVHENLPYDSWASFQHQKEKKKTERAHESGLLIKDTFNNKVKARPNISGLNNYTGLKDVNPSILYQAQLLVLNLVLHTKIQLMHPNNFVYIE